MMNDDVKKFLSNYVQLPDAEMDEIVRRFKRKVVRKNEFLLKQGSTCKDLVFVRSGCLRLYYLKDGIEVSVWFAFPDSSAVEIYSFISERPSSYFLQAIEVSEILFLPKRELTALYKIQPKMQEMMRNYWEDVILHLLKRFTALQTDSAEQRYLDLLNEPAYLRTVPQKYLASFLGVTPTSLSRIRRGILKKKKH